MAYHYAFMINRAVVREPESFAEADKDSQWDKAMNEEIQARDMGSCSPLTSQEGNRLQMDIQSEV